MTSKEELSANKKHWKKDGSGCNEIKKIDD